MVRQMNRTYKYRIYPNSEQKTLIEKTFGCVRFIYNKMLQERIAVYEKYKNDRATLIKQRYHLPAYYKKTYPWLKDVDSLALSNAQLNLQSAYRNFFRNEHFSFPKFKIKRDSKNSYTTNNQSDSIRLVDEKTIRVPKLKNMKIKLHRPVPNDAIIKAATLSKTPTGKYYIAILLHLPDGKAYDIKPLMSVPSKDILGDIEKAYEDKILEEKIEKEQKKLQRCKTGGKNYEKQRHKLAKLFEKKANRRKDFLHKLSRQIANAMIAEGKESFVEQDIETVDNFAVMNMLKIFLSYKIPKSDTA